MPAPTQLHVVRRRPGAGWASGRGLRDQPGWRAHATFMDGLVEEGFVVLGGPLAHDDDVLLVVDAGDGGSRDIRARLAQDPWEPDVLVTTDVVAWSIWLEGPGAAATGAPTRGPLARGMRIRRAERG